MLITMPNCSICFSFFPTYLFFASRLLKDSSVSFCVFTIKSFHYFMLEVYSEPCQISKQNILCKLISCELFSQKAPSQMFGRGLNMPLHLITIFHVAWKHFMLFCCVSRVIHRKQHVLQKSRIVFMKVVSACCKNSFREDFDFICLKGLFNAPI